MRPVVIIPVLLAIALVIGALLFVQSRPTVSDGGGVDTNVADPVPGTTDASVEAPEDAGAGTPAAPATTPAAPQPAPVQ